MKLIFTPFAFVPFLLLGPGCGNTEASAKGTHSERHAVCIFSMHFAKLGLVAFSANMERYPTNEEGLLILFDQQIAPDGEKVGPFLSDSEEIRFLIEDLHYSATLDGGYEVRDAEGVLLFER